MPTDKITANSDKYSKDSSGQYELYSGQPYPGTGPCKSNEFFVDQGWSSKCVPIPSDHSRP